MRLLSSSAPTGRKHPGRCLKTENSRVSKVGCRYFYDSWRRTRVVTTKTTRQLDCANLCQNPSSVIPDTRLQPKCLLSLGTALRNNKLNIWPAGCVVILWIETGSRLELAAHEGRAAVVLGAPASHWARGVAVLPSACSGTATGWHMYTNVGVLLQKDKCLESLLFMLI